MGAKGAANFGAGLGDSAETVSWVASARNNHVRRRQSTEAAAEAAAAAVVRVARVPDAKSRFELQPQAAKEQS